MTHYRVRCTNRGGPKYLRYRKIWDILSVGFSLYSLSVSQIRRIGRARLPTTDYVCISADPFRSPSEGSILGRSPRSAQQAASMDLVQHTTLSHITRTLSQRRIRQYIPNCHRPRLRCSSFIPLAGPGITPLPELIYRVHIP